ncbi:MAG: hypothetical protein ACXWUN_02955 [Allosphingosinicella sp.]
MNAPQVGEPAGSSSVSLLQSDASMGAPVVPSESSVLSMSSSPSTVSKRLTASALLWLVNGFAWP